MLILDCWVDIQVGASDWVGNWNWETLDVVIDAVGVERSLNDRNKYGAAGREMGTKQEGKKLTEELRGRDALLIKPSWESFKRERVQHCQKLQKDEKACCNG